MKNKSSMKWLGVLGASTVFAVTNTSAEPTKAETREEARVEAKDGTAIGQLAGKVADKTDGVPEKPAENREEAREQKSKRQESGNTGQTGKPADTRAAASDKKDSEGDRKMDADRPENREEARKAGPDSTGTNVDQTDTPTRAENRAEARKEAGDAKDRRVYQRGEFKDKLQDRDRERVVTYFAGFKDRENGLPPGLYASKKDHQRLPDGWRERLVPGYVVEENWLPALEPVSYELFPEINVVPDTRLYWYGDRVVRIYQPTREIVDVIIIPTIKVDL